MCVTSPFSPTTSQASCPSHSPPWGCPGSPLLLCFSPAAECGLLRAAAFLAAERGSGAQAGSAGGARPCFLRRVWALPGPGSGLCPCAGGRLSPRSAAGEPFSSSPVSAVWPSRGLLCVFCLELFKRLRRSGVMVLIRFTGF